MISFGPVPSRRLGRSLGINNIPPKACTYSCAYCQLGRTVDMQGKRCSFYQPMDVVQDVRDRVDQAREAKERVDYLAFVPDGEPTLDAGLGEEIEMLKPLGISIAVITNGTLITHDDVREDLRRADWVSLKVDSTRESVWRRINRPHGSLRLESILDGMIQFAEGRRGQLVTETMLVDGVNDDEGHILEVSDFLARLHPDRAYLSIPTRPPAEGWVRPAGEEAVNRAYQILSREIDHVECLIGYEGNAFSSTGDPVEDLLSITAVHPMREEAVRELLTRIGGDWALVQDLIEEGALVMPRYGGHRFLLRRFDRPASSRGLRT